MTELLVSFRDYAGHHMRQWLIDNVGPSNPVAVPGWSSGDGWEIKPKLGEVNCVQVKFGNDTHAMLFKLAFCDQLRTSTKESE